MNISPPSTDREAMTEWFAEQGLEYSEDVKFQRGLIGRILGTLLRMKKLPEEALFDEHEIGEVAPIRIAEINDNLGYGCFADENLSTGDFVGVYAGIIKPHYFGNQTTYSYGYPFSIFIETNATLVGNETRFFNHSDPNVVADNQLVKNVDTRIIYHDHLWKVIFQTNTTIPKGKELRINYGDKYFRKRKKEDSAFHLVENGTVRELGCQVLPTLADRLRYLATL